MIKDYTTILINVSNLPKTQIHGELKDFSNKAKGKYELVWASNDAPFAKELPFRRMVMKSCFSKTFFGENINVYLPSLSFFDYILGELKKSPQECIYIDTDVKNLLAAEEVGISPILFDIGNEHYCGMNIRSFDELWSIIG